MALTLTTAARNAACNAIVDLVDVGSTNASARIELMTSGDVEVATMVMSNPAFGAAVAGVATANSISNDSSATGGTVALFRVIDRDETEVWRGTVGTPGSGADVTMSTTTVGAGDIVAVSSFTFTMPSTGA